MMSQPQPSMIYLNLRELSSEKLDNVIFICLLDTDNKCHVKCENDAQSSTSFELFK